ncbi:hypothetical protein ACPYOC_02665 [Ornithinimicrobium sp. W1665]|uniref:hypothetical protein n=1 Tax=Ornithinimicrobium sp. W1665 TaxID=3416666 RepID=UPI003CE8C8B3
MRTSEPSRSDRPRPAQGPADEHGPVPDEHPSPRAESVEPADLDRPFLRGEGIRHGLTRHRVDGPAYHRLFGTVRAPSSVELSPSTLLEAARLVVPEAVASHHTAARLWGGLVPDTAEVHVTVPASKARRRRPGLRCHVRGPEFTRTTTLPGGQVPLTSPEQTFVDLAADLSLVDLVVLGDSLVHRGVTTPDRLSGAAARATGRGAAAAKEGAGLVRDGAESGMESRSRLLLVLGGLPEPQVNRWVLDETGRGRYRLDLPYPELQLAFEYDGRQHAEDARQWGWDLARREWLDGQGWRLVVLRAEDVYITPWATVRRARDALAARGFDVDLPVEAPLEFRHHFPGRPWRAARS